MKYTFKKSTNSKKKYDAFLDGKKVASFGAIKADGTPYEQFKDKIGLYSKYDHNDQNRKILYHKRHKMNYPEPSPDWFSKKYLW